VVRTAQGGRVIAVGATQAHAAVPARVEEGAYHPGLVAHQDHRIDAALAGHDVAALRDLALVSDEEPGATEDALELALIHFRVRENAPRDQPFRGSHDVLEVLATCQPRARLRCRT
jgi:hypothetical protein